MKSIHIENPLLHLPIITSIGYQQITVTYVIKKLNSYIFVYLPLHILPSPENPWLQVHL